MSSIEYLGSYSSGRKRPLKCITNFFPPAKFQKCKQTDDCSTYSLVDSMFCPENLSEKDDEFNTSYDSDSDSILDSEVSQDSCNSSQRTGYESSLDGFSTEIGCWTISDKSKTLSDDDSHFDDMNASNVDEQYNCSVFDLSCSDLDSGVKEEVPTPVSTILQSFSLCNYVPPAVMQLDNKINPQFLQSALVALNDYHNEGVNIWCNSCLSVDQMFILLCNLPGCLSSCANSRVAELRLSQLLEDKVFALSSVGINSENHHCVHSHQAQIKPTPSTSTPTTAPSSAYRTRRSIAKQQQQQQQQMQQSQSQDLISEEVSGYGLAPGQPSQRQTCLDSWNSNERRHWLRNHSAIWQRQGCPPDGIIPKNNNNSGNMDTHGVSPSTIEVASSTTSPSSCPPPTQTPNCPPPPPPPSSSGSACQTQQAKSGGINANMYRMVVDWMVDIATDFELQEQTLYLAVHYMNRYLARVTIPQRKFQLVGVTCLWLASKYEEITPPSSYQFAETCDGACGRTDMLEMEGELLHHLQFDMQVVTAKNFLDRIFNYIPLVNRRLIHLANYFLDMSLLDTRFIQYLPSCLAVSAICLAMHVLGIPDSSSMIEFLCAVYEDQVQLGECIHSLYSYGWKKINELFAFERKESLRTVALYLKYSKHQYCQVALTPLSPEPTVVIPL